MNASLPSTTTPPRRPTQRDLAQQFANKLRHIRENKHWSLRELESFSGVPNSHVSAMESGKRRCGAAAARRLADAFFGSHGNSKERDEFLYAAAATIKARGVIKDAELYPPAILDAVGYKLRRMGVRGRDIFKAAIDVTRPDGSQSDLTISTTRFEFYDVRISIVKRAGLDTVREFRSRS